MIEGIEIIKMREAHSMAPEAAAVAIGVTEGRMKLYETGEKVMAPEVEDRFRVIFAEAEPKPAVVKEKTVRPTRPTLVPKRALPPREYLPLPVPNRAVDVCVVEEAARQEFAQAERGRPPEHGVNGEAGAPTLAEQANFQRSQLEDTQEEEAYVTHVDFPHLLVPPEVARRLDDGGSRAPWSENKYPLPGRQHALKQVARYSRLLRCCARLTQRDLAELAGVSSTSIKSLENGESSYKSPTGGRVHYILAHYRNTGELLTIPPPLKEIERSKAAKLMWGKKKKAANPPKESSWLSHWQAWAAGLALLATGGACVVHLSRSGLLP